MRIVIHLVSAVCCLSFASAAELKPAPLFCDDAVLQQGKPVPVWGSADPGARVEVLFKGQTAEAVVAPSGRWQATLPAQQASSDPADLVIKTEGKTVTFRGVVVGEVWLCSGQSNMEWRVDQAADAENEIAAANFPLIRQFRVPKTPSETPAVDFKSAWVSADPKTVRTFSAVAYFFARDLHQTLKVPIGIINASWGGKMIEVFMSPEALASDPGFQAVYKRWEFEQKSLPARRAAWEKESASPSPGMAGQNAGTDVSDETAQSSAAAPVPGRRMDPRLVVEQHRPSCLFNGMISPTIPYALQGVIWYQGEHNIARAVEYRSLFPAFIKDLRQKFGQGDVPFYFVQLANFEAKLDKSREGYALLREAQLQTLSLPNTGMAVTVDIGTPENVHPKNKQDVGARLARIAKARTYGLGGIDSGPIFKSASREGASVRLNFDHIGGGLTASREKMEGFEIAGTDGKFHPATAKIEGETAVVEAAEVKEPAAVRYAWGNAPATSLFNKEGLPASPFRYAFPGTSVSF